ncbi:MAG: winged-helix domain-containing protein [Dehalococcoidia bacterium]
MSRERRTRDTLAQYLTDRQYAVTQAESYDEAMQTLLERRPQGMIVDVQGLPRGEEGCTFPQFGQWLATTYGSHSPALIYLLHKGARRPHFRVEGTVIKKPFPLESIGKAIRERVGSPRNEGDAPSVQLDLGTNTLRSAHGEAHLTNIEAALLAYFMEHEGETLHPRSLLVDVWQYRDSAGASTLVRAHVSNLRRKLRSVQDGAANQIQTIRGRGYRFVA